MARIQQELETKTVVGEAGGGMVRVTANGKQHITAITIDKEVVNPGGRRNAGGPHPCRRE
jgi:DNA-binding protein YbaB